MEWLENTWEFTNNVWWTPDEIFDRLVVAWYIKLSGGKSKRFPRLIDNIHKNGRGHICIGSEAVTKRR